MMRQTALLYDPDTDRWLQFDAPRQVYSTSSLSEVKSLLAKVETEVNRQALHAVGFVSYEASPAFEPTARTAPNDDFPLLWFGLFEAPKEVPPPVAHEKPDATDWIPELTEQNFIEKVEQIKTAIAAGETYQVNFTFALTTPYRSDPWPLFCRLMQNQPDSYGVWIDTGRYAIASASPELFFERANDRLSSKPMKGTTTRGPTLTEDRIKADTLQTSAKERAENIMVLDMIRNDLARLPGGPVEVEALCAVEKHPTVWQMTSTASTTTDASLLDIFERLFPCASITGAPKLRTMHHITDLETTPRGIYTGTIGHIAPNRQARFSVAIRTALIDRETQTASYGIGAGITWDSEPVAEYRECLAKAQILHQTRPPFELLESLLWEPDSGYFLLEEHLDRMEQSADYFDYPFDRTEAMRELQKSVRSAVPCPHKIRLLIDKHGVLNSEATVINPPDKNNRVRVCIAEQSVVTTDPFLYHKTTARSVYDKALQAATDCDEVLLYNERGEITEACNANLVVRLEGELVTPPIECGLLAGTLRADLLAKGEIKERIIRIDDLHHCTELYLINSIRRWRPVDLISDLVKKGD